MGEEELKEGQVKVAKMKVKMTGRAKFSWGTVEAYESNDLASDLVNGKILKMLRRNPKQSKNVEEIKEWSETRFHQAEDTCHLGTGNHPGPSK